MNFAAITLCSMLLAGTPKHHDAKADGGVALTPMDQSNSESDVKLTQAIRKALVDDDRLSFSSKNAKIITRSGEVTLRGQVPNKTERALIREIAQQVAGVKNVIDQLEYPASDAAENTN
jgi:osmotically-inducible protein OsmY